VSVDKYLRQRKNCVKTFDTKTPNGPLPPFAKLAIAAAQLHQIGRS
jgi:hypothetical protein